MKATHEAQGLPGELRALQVRAGGRDVALVEHQVQHMLDRCQPRSLLGRGWQLKACPRLPQPMLSP